MKFLGILSALLLIGSLNLAYAHPDSLGFTVQNQDGEILVQQKLNSPEKESTESIEIFSDKWFYYNFIWILTGILVLIITVSAVVTYREELTLILKSNNQ